MEKKSTKAISKLEHAIHVLLTLGTSGAWLLVYLPRVFLSFRNAKKKRIDSDKSSSRQEKLRIVSYKRRNFASSEEAEEDEWNEFIDVYSFNIVGESHYRENLLSLIDKRNAHKLGELNLEAELIKEPNNKFDNSAVGVWINGLKVGHIPKEYSYEVTEFIDTLSSDGIRVDAVIGWNTSSPNPPIGVRLDFNF